MQVMNSDLYNITTDNVKKLMPNFFDKEKYVFHYLNLQFYLRLGLKLTKYNVYDKIINHKQATWLAENSKKRTANVM